MADTTNINASLENNSSQLSNSSDNLNDNNAQESINNSPKLENQTSTVPTPSFVTMSPDQSPFSPPKTVNTETSAPPPPVFTQTDMNSSTNGSMIANFKPRKKSNGLVLGVIVLLLILVGGAAAYYFSKNTNTQKNDNNNTIPKEQITLTYWGLWEPTSVMQSIIEEYQTQNPNVVINYIEQTKTDYRTRLQSAIENGTGPDIFRYHNTWFPMLKNNMQPDSKKIVPMDDYYPIIKENAVIGGETFGVPLGFDTLALYYNLQKFQSAGISQPPTSWEELISDAEKLVVTDPKAGMQVGGVAMGTTNNVDHWSDIVGLLLMQNESDPATEIPSEVLEFYTQFVDVKKVWDATLPSSTYAFATEKVAMIFAPSWRAHEIKAINPNIQFKTAVVPQLSGANQAAWATYWLEGVSRQSKNSQEAWKFLAFLSNSENLTKLYTSASQSSKERTFGEPYPKISLASSIQNDPIVGSFVSQGSYAKSWYLCSRTFDDGLNDMIIKYFEDAINEMNEGATSDKVLPTLTSGINQKLGLFGLSNSIQN